ncbi:dihydrofolate reductase [Pajaroellobacter abortibovis]|uniref:Dihydrofolate reductase n=1 Tax=Pajaroellobacter abortibovis TaxID=1882918 RepID=A0A1L6MUW0_9BACT|nr:dihydrofolate reductase [Pajaroellobacter abortibovis]APR99298.1 hypothetical protein BCY86_00370 [Pajaroellobacter abortibovis]
MNSATITRAPLILVVAMTSNRVIGHHGKLPWHLPEDLRHFRMLTEGHAVIMGRKTHESIGRPLPQRRNIVLTHRPIFLPGCESAHTLEEALSLAREHDPEPRIIGGATLYEQSLPLATRIYLTEVLQHVEGDTWFPPFSLEEWYEVSREQMDPVVFSTWERIL